MSYTPLSRRLAPRRRHPSLGAKEDDAQTAIRAQLCASRGGSWTGSVCDWSAVCDRRGEVWTGADSTEPSCRPFEDKYPAPTPSPGPSPGSGGPSHAQPKPGDRSSYVLPVLMILGGLYYLVKRF